MRQSHVVGLKQSAVFSMSALPSAQQCVCVCISVSVCLRVCECVCVREMSIWNHLLQVLVSHNGHLTKREWYVFFNRGCSCYILLAKLTPGQCQERASPHSPRLCVSSEGKVFHVLTPMAELISKQVSIYTVQDFHNAFGIEWLFSDFW